MKIFLPILFQLDTLNCLKMIKYLPEDNEPDKGQVHVELS